MSEARLVTGSVYVYTDSTEEHSARTQTCVPGRVMIDFAQDGRLLGVEVLDATRVTIDGQEVPAAAPASEVTPVTWYSPCGYSMPDDPVSAPLATCPKCLSTEWSTFPPRYHAAPAEGLEEAHHRFIVPDCDWCRRVRASLDAEAALTRHESAGEATE